MTEGPITAYSCLTLDPTRPQKALPEAMPILALRPIVCSCDIILLAASTAAALLSSVVLPRRPNVPIQTVPTLLLGIVRNYEI